MEVRGWVRKVSEGSGDSWESSAEGRRMSSRVSRHGTAGSDCGVSDAVPCDPQACGAEGVTSGVAWGEVVGMVVVFIVVVVVDIVVVR